MADISVTATAVVAASDAAVAAKLAGGTITAGQPVCLNPSTGKLEPVDVDGASAYLKSAIGIALNGGAVNQPIRYIIKGLLTLNAVLTKGTIYLASDDAGGICPSADAGSGDTIVILGVAVSTTVLDVNIINTGIEV